MVLKNYVTYTLELPNWSMKRPNVNRYLRSKRHSWQDEGYTRLHRWLIRPKTRNTSPFLTSFKHDDFVNFLKIFAKIFYNPFSNSFLALQRQSLNLRPRPASILYIYVSLTFNNFDMTGVKNIKSLRGFFEKGSHF